MTRDQFINDQIDQYAGMLLDALVERQGAERSAWLRMAYAKLKARLGACYDLLCPPVKPDPPKPAPAANGQPTGQSTKKVQ